MSEIQTTSFPCNQCQAGAMQLQFITYFTWLHGELITVPGFPAWVCDVCGKREYDQRAVNWLSTLLTPSAGRKPRRPLPHKPLLGKRGTSRPANS